MANEPYWTTELFTYDASNNLVRMGKHKKENASEFDAGWYIWTFAYDGNGNLTNKNGPTIGRWTE